MMRFSRLTLANWRNFQAVDVPLPRRVFLVGPNASGKSNFLDALRFLRDVASSGLQAAVKARQGVSRLRCLAARQSPAIHVAVEVLDEPEQGDPVRWSYALEFDHAPKEGVTLRRERVRRNDQVVLDRPDPSDREDRLRLTQTHLEQINANAAFRPLAQFLEGVRYLHLVPHIVRDPERSGSRREDPFGGDLLVRLAESSPRKLKGRLRLIQKALEIAVPQFKDLAFERGSDGTPHLKALYEHWRPQGAWQTEELFSDGTLRLFGLMWALLEGQGPLLLEEPELSLHAAIVRHLAGLLHRLGTARGRQVIASTHSRDLLQDPGIGGEEVLLLHPSREGTKVSVGKDDRQARALLENGATVAEAVLPRTEPKEPIQLPLFDDPPE